MYHDWHRTVGYTNLNASDSGLHDRRYGGIVRGVPIVGYTTPIADMAELSEVSRLLFHKTILSYGGIRDSRCITIAGGGHDKIGNPHVMRSKRIGNSVVISNTTF
ncbi:hypothetical protein DPMN_090529 [Dreissena polymorpha]|uniref:Uncharacterized protein n=1 Tax=Dreissena polymorpha TaxID=45954 RepID=A0A9D4KZW8_DREPO|nr:hypothetical protein DPMN_090529 [Dreissena polymorpha]